VPSNFSNAQINLANGAVTGFARACGGTVDSDDNATAPVNPGHCTSMTSRPDGWDGWIELSGANHQSPDPGNSSGPSMAGVWLNTKTGLFSGYAWGGLNVGWTSFSPAIGFASGNPGNPIAQVVQVACTSIGGCGGSGSNFANTCIFSTITRPDSTVSSVTFNSSVSGGTAPYAYLWSDASTTRSVTYTTPGTYNVSAVATDSTSPNPVTAKAVCPSVTVTAPSSSLSLKIGNSASTANSTSLQVRQGSTFGLKWDNELPLDPMTGYQCTRSVTPSDVSAWDAIWTNALVNVSGVGMTINPLQTTGVAKGTYNLTITCTNAVDQTHVSKAVQLQIISPSETEI